MKNAKELFKRTYWKKVQEKHFATSDWLKLVRTKHDARTRPIIEEPEMKNNVSEEFVRELSKPSKEFCIIGLTGKVRSGTSDVCKLLTDCDFPKRLPMPDSRNMLGNKDAEEARECRIDEEDEEAREYRIIYRYLRDNWKPFVEVSVTSVIISYLLDIGIDNFNALSKEHGHGKQLHPLFQSVDEIFNQGKINKDFAKKVIAQLKSVYCTLFFEKNAPINEDHLNYQTQLWSGVLRCIKDKETLFNVWEEKIQPFLEKKTQLKTGNTQTTNLHSIIFVYCFGILPLLEENIKHKLSSTDQYPFLFQDFGNSIRASGSILQVLTKGTSNAPIIKASHLFDLSKRINQFIKVLRGFNSTFMGDDAGRSDNEEKAASPVFVVINNFKNIFEAYYFKRRYAAFYLMAVSCEETARKEKFPERVKYGKMRLREELSLGKKVFKKADNHLGGFISDHNEIEKQLNNSPEKLSEIDKAFIKDCFSNQILYDSYKNSLSPFILQDVISCIENSDIFVTRDYAAGDRTYDQQLIKQLARTSTLIMHPGLLVPTKIERCMQIAMTAKLNSGCLSRQVGAVVTDKDYNILSLGWNDAPCGAEICLRRNLFDIINKEDKRAYSNYELFDQEYRDYLETVSEVLLLKKSDLNGLPMAFCFKDIYQDLISQRDQIYTRALHGEERAIASCNSDAMKGGYLFTTSSPCELCAKRAKQAGIMKIYYIELYPGISRDHVIEVGQKQSRADYEFFVGATGMAYIKLYTPLIPYKDELAALGYSPSIIYKNVKNGKIN